MGVIRRANRRSALTSQPAPASASERLSHAPRCLPARGAPSSEGQTLEEVRSPCRRRRTSSSAWSATTFVDHGWKTSPRWLEHLVGVALTTTGSGGREARDRPPRARSTSSYGVRTSRRAGRTCLGVSARRFLSITSSGSPSSSELSPPQPQIVLIRLIGPPSRGPSRRQPLLERLDANPTSPRGRGERPELTVLDRSQDRRPMALGLVRGGPGREEPPHHPEWRSQLHQLHF